jgi:hypothetical protein
MTSIYSNASSVLRNKALIDGLMKNGYEIHILTIDNSASNPYNDKSIKWDKKIKIISLKKNNIYSALTKSENTIRGRIKKNSLPFIRKIYHTFSIFDNTVSIAKKVNKECLPRDHYDFIISSSDPKTSHITANKLITSGLKYGKWIQYWGDPLTIDITKKTIYPHFILKHIEKKMLSSSDKIIYVSPFTLDSQKKLFPEFSNKMHFLPTPVTFNESNNSCDTTKNDHKYTIGYFGSYTSKVRNLIPLYNVCKNNELNLIIAGGSDLELKSTNNISIYSRITQEKVNEYEKECYILVCVLNKVGTQIPGKVYHYASTSNPILIILDGEYKDEMRKYFDDYNRYVFCENDEKTIFAAIEKIKHDNKQYKPCLDFEPKNIASLFLE